MPAPLDQLMSTIDFINNRGIWGEFPQDAGLLIREARRLSNSHQTFRCDGLEVDGNWIKVTATHFDFFLELNRYLYNEDDKKENNQILIRLDYEESDGGAPIIQSTIERIKVERRDEYGFGYRVINEFKDKCNIHVEFPGLNTTLVHHPNVEYYYGFYTVCNGVMYCRHDHLVNGELPSTTGIRVIHLPSETVADNQEFWRKIFDLRGLRLIGYQIPPEVIPRNKEVKVWLNIPPKIKENYTPFKMQYYGYILGKNDRYDPETKVVEVYARGSVFDMSVLKNCEKRVLINNEEMEVSEFRIKTPPYTYYAPIHEEEEEEEVLAESSLINLNDLGGYHIKWPFKGQHLNYEERLLNPRPSLKMEILWHNSQVIVAQNLTLNDFEFLMRNRNYGQRVYYLFGGQHDASIPPNRTFIMNNVHREIHEYVPVQNREIFINVVKTAQTLLASYNKALVKCRANPNTVVLPNDILMLLLMFIGG